MENYGFVYLWYDKKHKRYYIGCRWGREDDGYICSSTWMKQGYRRRPTDFKRRILNRIYTNRKDLLEEEYKWLSKIKKEELGKKYYNLYNHHFGHWSSDPKKVEDMKSKNSGSNNPMFGKIPYMKGRTHTEEAKQKIKLARSKQIYTEKTKQKISNSHIGEKNHFYGKKHTKETRERMSMAAKGRKCSVETRMKMSKSRKKYFAERKKEKVFVK
jgi:hypothetical protein